MSQTIVNLALPVVDEKIEEVLGQYPMQPHQAVFGSNDWRQKLVAYVLSRMPSLYAAMDEKQGCSLKATTHCYSLEQHHHIGQLVHQGIQHLLRQHQCQHQGVPTLASEMPSSWFG